VPDIRETPLPVLEAALKVDEHMLWATHVQIQAEIERRCAAASDEQITAVQTRLRRCVAAASLEVPGGAPEEFLIAIEALRSRPQLMLDLAPEFRSVVESALGAVGA
jgi:hypothetical protein